MNFRYKVSPAQYLSLFKRIPDIMRMLSKEGSSSIPVKSYQSCCMKCRVSSVIGSYQSSSRTQPRTMAISYIVLKFSWTVLTTNLGGMLIPTFHRNCHTCTKWLHKFALQPAIEECRMYNLIFSHLDLFLSPLLFSGF